MEEKHTNLLSMPLNFIQHTQKNILSLGAGCGKKDAFVYQTLVKCGIEIDNISIIDTNFKLLTAMEKSTKLPMEKFTFHLGAYGNVLRFFKEDSYNFVTAYKAFSSLQINEIENVLGMLHTILQQGSTLHFSGMFHENREHEEHAIHYEEIHNDEAIMCYAHSPKSYVRAFEKAGFIIEATEKDPASFPYRFGSFYLVAKKV